MELQTKLNFDFDLNYFILISSHRCTHFSHFGSPGRFVFSSFHFVCQHLSFLRLSQILVTFHANFHIFRLRFNSHFNFIYQYLSLCHSIYQIFQFIFTYFVIHFQFERLKRSTQIYITIVPDIFLWSLNRVCTTPPLLTKQT